MMSVGIGIQRFFFSQSMKKSEKISGHSGNFSLFLHKITNHLKIYNQNEQAVNTNAHIKNIDIKIERSYIGSGLSVNYLNFFDYT